MAQHPPPPPELFASTDTACVGPLAPRNAGASTHVSIGTPRGLAVFGTALTVGLFGEAFLRIAPLGLNVLMGIGLLFAALGVLARWQQIALVGQGRWLVWPALFFAASFAWRDSLTLHWINGLALLVTLVLASRYTRSGQMQYLYISQWAAGLVQSSVRVLEGLFVLVSYDIQWKKFAGGTWADQFRPLNGGSIWLFLLSCSSEDFLSVLTPLLSG